jgi:hypothetical protein
MPYAPSGATGTEEEFIYRQKVTTQYYRKLKKNKKFVSVLCAFIKAGIIFEVSLLSRKSVRK